MIELGIGMFGDVQIDPTTGKIQPAAARMQEIIEEVKLMDQVGVDFFGMGEHHREDYAVSAPEMMLAAAATVTTNIKLGSAVSVLSSADPVKLFQDFSSLDILSGGRAEIMAGRGSFIESFPLFGYDLKDYAELFEEKLELLTRLNKQDTITWSGRFRKPLVNQQIFPRPVRGSLPIWVAVGGTTSSVVRAARLGLPVMFAIIGGAPENFKPLFELYRQSWVDNGHDIQDLQVGVHMHSFFGEDGTTTADKYYPIYGGQMNRIGASRGWPAYQRSQFDFGRSIHGHLIVGDVNHAIEKILHFIEMFGLTRFSAHMDVGSPDHKDMMRAIELYGTQIIPKVKEALEKGK